MKSYIFRVIVEEDALEDVKRITPPAQPQKAATPGATRTLKRSHNIQSDRPLRRGSSWRPGEAIPVDPEPGAGESFRNGLTDVSGCTLIRNRLEPHDEVRHASEPRVRDVARSALRCLNLSRWVLEPGGPK